MKYSNSQIGIAPAIAVLVIAVILTGLGGMYYFRQHQAKKVSLSSVNSFPKEWVGEYHYSEFTPPNQTWVYKLTVSQEGNALLDVDGFQTLVRIQASVKENNGRLEIVFDNYGPENTYARYQKGDLLFSLGKSSDSKYKILWDKLKSNLLTPPVDAVFTKISTVTSKNQTEKDIILGRIAIDSKSAAELQKNVGEGHQPWRLDPLLVAKAESLNYGFYSTDVFSLKETAASAGVAKVEATHKGKVYLITLVKPVPGEGQIWVIQDIEKGI